MAKLFAFLINLSIVLFSFGAPAKKQAGVSSESKLQQISDLATKSKGHVITLDDSTYSYYATSKPRPYNLVIFLTANHPKFKCGVCKQLDNELSLLATSYASQVKGNKEEESTFFLRLDYESSQKVFQSYGLNSVPMLFYVGSSDTTSSKEYEVLHRDRYQVPADPDAESLASFLNDRSGVSVKIQRSMIGSYITLVVVFGVLAALVQPVINSLPFWLRIIQAKPLWMLVSAGVYTCAISGLIFDIIRSPQMYYANPQTGKIQFFYPQSGNQFVAEGFIIGFLNVGCGVAAIVLAYVAPRVKDEQTRTMVVVLSMVAFFICFRSIRSLYIMKNNWYGQVY